MASGRNQSHSGKKKRYDKKKKTGFEVFGTPKAPPMINVTEAGSTKEETGKAKTAGE